MMVIGRFDALFRHGPHGQASTPIGVVQRNHGGPLKLQVATECHPVRNGRPTVTGTSNAIEPTIVVTARARSGEKDRRGITTVGEEIITKVGIEIGGILDALHVEIGVITGILSGSGESCKGVVGRQVEADRAGVINRFDHREIVTGVRILRSGVIGRP